MFLSPCCYLPDSHVAQLLLYMLSQTKKHSFHICLLLCFAPQRCGLLFALAVPVWITVNENNATGLFISLLCGDLVSISLCLSALRQPAREACKALIVY